MRIGVAVPLNSTVYRLRDAVSRETKIPMDQVLFLSLSSAAFDTGRLCYSSTLFLKPVEPTFVTDSMLAKWIQCTVKAR